MDMILIYVGTTIGGIILYLIIGALVRAPGSALQSKFIMLTAKTNGEIKGKTYDEIVATCGRPTSVSPIGDGGKVCQWMATGYHIALLFDANNVCLGVSHEAKV